MRSTLLLAALLCAAALAHADNPDIIYADFEKADYGDWKVEGEAFGQGPARGALLGQMPVDGFVGGGLANSFHHGDNAKGALTSADFTIDRHSIVFLIGGGGFAGETCLNLVIDGKVARTATGRNTEPGGTERLELAGWDVSEFAGRTAHLQIVDQREGTWGHICVDQIVFTDRPVPKRVENPTREFDLDEQYLLFPISTGSQKHRVSLLVDGKVVREFEAELNEDPAFWTQLDVSAWKGKKGVVRIDWLTDNSSLLAAIQKSPKLWAADRIYQEPLRGLIHFSPKRGWTNDPNGLVWSQGEYHLYFQHNPYGWGWGNMHWGHAVSRDLVHWEEQPIALYPAKYGDWAFSGSAVVDKDNTSGWKSGENDLLVGAYTSTGRGECIVYSNDKGRTWTEYTNNPVIKHQGRDPRLLWHEPTHQWVMAVYSEDPVQGADPKAPVRVIAFYTSPDLKDWTYQSRVSNFFECPDLFQLPVDGDAKNMKWVLTAASSEYMVGSFDGKTFTPETPKLAGHRGRGFYAAQTFSNEPKGRRVQIGWFQTETKDMPFNQAMSVPLQLSLHSGSDGIHLAWQPVEELQSLREKAAPIEDFTLADKERPLEGVKGEALEIRADLAPENGAVAGFRVRGIDIGYDEKTHLVHVGDLTATAPLRGGKISFIILVDRTCVEVFADDGLVYMPVNLAPKPAEQSVIAYATRGSAAFHAVQGYRLHTSWPQPPAE